MMTLVRDTRRLSGNHHGLVGGIRPINNGYQKKSNSTVKQPLPTAHVSRKRKAGRSPRPGNKQKRVKKTATRKTKPVVKKTPRKKDVVKAGAVRVKNKVSSAKKSVLKKKLNTHNTKSPRL
jgi:hypothetical protein